MFKFLDRMKEKKLTASESYRSLLSELVRGGKLSDADETRLGDAAETLDYDPGEVEQDAEALRLFYAAAEIAQHRDERARAFKAVNAEIAQAGKEREEMIRAMDTRRDALLSDRGRAEQRLSDANSATESVENIKRSWPHLFGDAPRRDTTPATATLIQTAENIVERATPQSSPDRAAFVHRQLSRGIVPPGVDGAIEPL